MSVLAGVAEEEQSATGQADVAREAPKSFRETYQSWTVSSETEESRLKERERLHLFVTRNFNNILVYLFLEMYIFYKKFIYEITTNIFLTLSYYF